MYENGKFSQGGSCDLQMLTLHPTFLTKQFNLLMHATKNMGALSLSDNFSLMIDLLNHITDNQTPKVNSQRSQTKIRDQ